MNFNMIKRFSAFILLCVAQAASSAMLLPAISQGQILSRGDLFGPGAPPPMAGIEIGIGQHSEMGILACDCNSTFTGGTGKGLIGSLFFELPLDYEWAIGVKAGIDFKNFSTVTALTEIVVVVHADSQTSTQPLYVNRTANIKTTYLDFAPYVQYQFFRMGPF